MLPFEAGLAGAISGLIFGALATLIGYALRRHDKIKFLQQCIADSISKDVFLFKNHTYDSEKYIAARAKQLNTVNRDDVRKLMISLQQKPEPREQIIVLDIKAARLVLHNMDWSCLNDSDEVSG